MQLLAIGEPKNVIAAKLEITTMTLYRWEKLPEFESKLNSINSSGLEEIAKMTNAATLTALETLQDILCRLDEPRSTQIKVALGVLKVMPSVNCALEKALEHRVGDFDLDKRWDIGSRFDGSGNLIQKPDTIKIPENKDVVVI